MNASNDIALNSLRKFQLAAFSSLLQGTLHRIAFCMSFIVSVLRILSVCKVPPEIDKNTQFVGWFALG